MLKVWWFPEYTPSEQLIFDDIKRIIETSYASFWYVHIETPAVEKNEILLKGGEEASKEIFGLYGMASGADDLKGYGLRFDLTIPFTRYVLDHQQDLVFPFKRYQVQKVRRGERQQKWRFKEFYQADIDVIRRQGEGKVKYLRYDAELIYLLRKTLELVRAKYLPDFVIKTHINNRNILGGLFTHLVGDDMEKKQQLSKLFDSYYKMSKEDFEQSLSDLVGDQLAIVQQFLSFDITTLSEDFIDNEEYRTGVGQLKEVFASLNLLNTDLGNIFVYDPFIVRGLDYYTGTVFENLIENDIAMGSICSWGRYANLTQSLDPKSVAFDGVGGSIGLSRLFTLILENYSSEQQKSSSEYLLLHFSETFASSLSIAKELQKQGKIVEVYPWPDKLKKQFAYADKKWIQKVIICGEEELEQGVYKVKDMETGEEEVIQPRIPSCYGIRTAG